MKVSIEGKTVELNDKEVTELKLNALAEAESFLYLIEDSNMREFASKLWEKAPDYFFVIPASSSGKYHAEWATGFGGLVRHVLTGVQAAYDLSFTFGLTDKETDEALVAVFGHDCLKYGVDYDSRYHEMHPFLPRSYYGGVYSDGFIGREFLYEELGFERFDKVMSAIESHMGNLDKGSWTSVRRVVPETKVEQVVHLADYFSSRKNFVLTGFIDYMKTTKNSKVTI